MFPSFRGFQQPCSQDNHSKPPLYVPLFQRLPTAPRVETPQIQFSRNFVSDKNPHIEGKQLPRFIFLLLTIDTYTSLFERGVWYHATAWSPVVWYHVKDIYLHDFASGNLPRIKGVRPPRLLVFAPCNGKGCERSPLVYVAKVPPFILPTKFFRNFFSKKSPNQRFTIFPSKYLVKTTRFHTFVPWYIIYP